MRWSKVSFSQLQKKQSSFSTKPILNNLELVYKMAFSTLYWNALKHGSMVTKYGSL